jgi:DNA-binding GntR family transcriptional regulator
LRERAIREIRAAIVYGSLARDELHSTAELAGRLKMSVTPVREALQHLAAHGMVTPRRNRGFLIVEPSREELEAALEVRLLLEVPTVARLAGTLSDEQTGELRSLVDRGMEAARDDDLVSFLELDREFHLRLLACAGNRRLVDLVDRLRDRLRFEGFGGAGGSVALTEVAEGHREMLSAVVTGRPDDAAGATRAHLMLTRRVWPAASAHR